jgi:hypothetical protein
MTSLDFFSGEITFGESYRCLESAIEYLQSLPDDEIVDHSEDGTVIFDSEPPAIFTATQVLFWVRDYSTYVLAGYDEHVLYSPHRLSQRQSSSPN